MATPGLRITLGDHQDFADVIVGGHRCIDRDRQRHGIAVFGDLWQFDRNLAILGGLAAGEFGDLVSRLLDAGEGAVPQPTTESAAPPAPSISAARRDNCRIGSSSRIHGRGEIKARSCRDHSRGGALGSNRIPKKNMLRLTPLDAE